MTKEKSSQISGFYKLSIEDRLKKIRDFAGLNNEDISNLKCESALELNSADKMIENVIGTMPIPLGVATNFLINGKDYIIPMATEEPSVVAAASNAARIARINGGFTTKSDESIMIGQIQVIDVKNPDDAKITILSSENKQKILNLANEQDPILNKFGGGAKDIEVRILDTPGGQMLICHLLVDCKDAMGANAVNTMAESVAPIIEELTGGKVILKIISNLAVKRLVKAEGIFDKDALGGEGIVDGIIDAYNFAASDPYRCATHNKGIMNGISAAVLATGNDTRAIEAGAHGYSAINGYIPLTKYKKNSDGNLAGEIELPIAVGLVGGATSVHPVAKINVKILGVKTARELGGVIASVGLAQNLAALRALASEGIQRGHMKLHARNVAKMAGADDEILEKVAKMMIKEGKVRVDRAKEIIEELKIE